MNGSDNHFNFDVYYIRWLVVALTHAFQSVVRWASEMSTEKYICIELFNTINLY